MKNKTTLRRNKSGAASRFRSDGDNQPRWTSVIELFGTENGKPTKQIAVDIDPRGGWGSVMSSATHAVIDVCRNPPTEVVRKGRNGEILGVEYKDIAVTEVRIRVKRMTLAEANKLLGMK